MFDYFKVTAVASLIGLGTLTGTPAVAATPGASEQDKLKLDIGVFFFQSVDTTIRLDKLGATAGSVGTSIDLSRDLDVSERETTGRFDGYYRFSPHHRIDWSYFSIERDGAQTLSRDIEYGGISFSAGEIVESFLNTKVGKLAYTFSFHHDDKVELGIGAGLHFSDIEAGIAATVGGKSGNLAATAPLPVFRALLNYHISPKWSVQLVQDTFVLDYDNYSGALSDARLVTEYMTFDKVGFGFGFQRFHMALEAEKSDFLGRIENTYNGFLLYVTTQM